MVRNCCVAVRLGTCDGECIFFNHQSRTAMINLESSKISVNGSMDMVKQPAVLEPVAVSPDKAVLGLV